MLKFVQFIEKPFNGLMTGSMGKDKNLSSWLFSFWTEITDYQ